jgi:hypothetical protein
MEGNTASIPTGSLVMPFPVDLEAGLKAFFVLTFFTGGVAFMKSNDQDTGKAERRSG